MSLGSALSSLRSSKSGRSTRDSLLEIIREQQKQNSKILDHSAKIFDQILADRGAQKEQIAGDLVTQEFQEGSQRDSVTGCQSDCESIQSISLHKSQLDKSLQTKSFVDSIQGHSFDGEEEVEGIAPYINGNETFESQSHSTSKLHTSFIGSKAHSNDFTFNQADKRRQADECR